LAGYQGLFESQCNAKKARFGPGKKEDDPNAVLCDEVAIGMQSPLNQPM
jgi:hypothetical protein